MAGPKETTYHPCEVVMVEWHPGTEKRWTPILKCTCGCDREFAMKTGAGTSTDVVSAMVERG